MSTDAGVCGAFGFLLSDYKGEPWYHEITEMLAEAIEAAEGDVDAVDTKKALKLIQGKLKANGVKLPKGAELHYTGSDDDRPGRCSAPAEDWVIGFGMLTKPWEWPPMNLSFRNKSDFHTWVWAG